MLSLWMGNVPPEGQPWAADNGRFAAPERYSDELYLRFLQRHSEHRARCLFATAPDVWGDAATTLELSLPMLPRIRAAGYPVALVAQDGLTVDAVPWDDIDALFVGGSDPWRGSESMFELVGEARRLGKWAHLGRVNSLRRVRAAAAAGFDSTDGTVLRFDQSRPVEQWAAAAHPGLGL